MARPRLISDSQILDATRRAVFEQGPGVSLEVVANALGVSQPALLKRFGSRRDLMLAALRPPEPPFLAMVDAGPDERPFATQLTEVLQVMSAFYEEHAPRMTALRESGIPMCDIYPNDDTPPPIRTIRRLAAWLERAQARQLVGPVDVETTAFALMATFVAHSHMKHMLQRAPVRGTQRSFVESVVHFFSRALKPTTTVHKRRSGVRHESRRRVVAGPRGRLQKA